MKKIKIFKAVIAVAVLALILPSSAIFADIEINMNNQIFDNIDDEKELSETLDDIDWWPMFHHDLANTGYSTSSAPNNKNILWSYDTGYTDNIVYSCPVVVDNKLYILSEGKRNVYCLNATTGDLIWISESKYDNINTRHGPVSTPAVADGKVFTGISRSLRCLNAVTGDIIWVYPTDYYIKAGPAVANGKVFIGSGDGDNNIYCLNATTGDLIWKFTMDGPAYVSTPAVIDDRVYMGSSTVYSEYSKFYCLNATTGNLIWDYTTYHPAPGDSLIYSPAVAYGRVFIGTSGNLYCLNATTGDLIWDYPAEATSSPAVAYGNMFIYAKYSLYCLNAITGDYIWHRSLGLSYASLAVADDKIYTGGCEGINYCLNATTGDTIWNTTPGDYYSHSSPAIANGRVYVGVASSILKCFGDYEPTVVSIDPPTQTVNKNETFTVDVFVEPAEPIIAVNVDLLSFDPILIQANSVTEGDLFAGLTTFFIPGTIDNINGTISLISVVTIPATGVSDPGTFCIIEFTALDQFGTSILDLEGVEASDELGNPVSVAVNDGSVTIGTNQPPYQPSDPDPYDGETDVDINADLSWTGGDPNPDDTVTYDVYFGTDSPPPKVVSNQSETTYNPGIMNQNTTYYWQIVAWDNHGLCTESPIWTFITEEEMPPEIEIEISGGFGINAIIRNIGDIDITDLEWRIFVDIIDKGFIFGGDKTDIINHLPAGEEEAIRSIPFGFGRIQICVTAECEETTEKFLLGFFILPK